MVHRLLDVLMQDAWSLTAFDNLAVSRPGQIHAAFFFGGLFIYIKYSLDSERENYID